MRVGLEWGEGGEGGEDGVRFRGSEWGLGG